MIVRCQDTSEGRAKGDAHVSWVGPSVDGGGRDTWEEKHSMGASLRGIKMGSVSGRAVWGWGVQPSGAQLDPRPGRVLTGGADPGIEVNG